MTDHNFTFWEPYDRTIGSYQQVITVGARKCDSRNTAADWNLMLIRRPVISSPSPRLLTREVAGMDGLLDITEDLDLQIYYEEREIRLEFLSAAGRDTMDAERAAIMSFVHGKYLILVDEDLPDWYWIGHWHVSYEEDKSGAFALITITGTVYPYRLAWSTYFREHGYIELTPSQPNITLTLDDSDWMSSPTIQLTGASKGYAFVGLSAVSYTIQAGVQQNPGILLGGENKRLILGINSSDFTSDTARIALYWRRGIF